MSSDPELRDATPRQDPNRLRRISGRTAFMLVVLIGLVAHFLQWVLLPFVIAGLMAYLCSVPVNWLAARTGFRRTYFAVGAFIFVLILAAIVGWLVVPPLLQGFGGITDHVRKLVENLAKSLIGDKSVDLFGASMTAQQLGQAVIADLRNWLGQTTVLAEIGGFTFAGLFGIPMTLVLFLYFLVGGPKIRQGLLWLVPPTERAVAQRIWRKLDPVLKRYFIGVVAVVIYASTAAYIGLNFGLGVPYAGMLAVMTGFLELIPVIGPAVSGLVAGLVAVENAKGVEAIIAYTGYAIALRLSIDEFFGPLVLGRASRLHPSMIMFCFLAGAAIYGIAGVLMAVPTALAVRTALTVLYEDAPEETKL